MIRFSSIGDIVLTSAVVRCVFMQIPKAEIHFVTKEGFESLLSFNRYIYKVHVLRESGLSLLIKDLKKENFDLVIDLHNNMRSHIIGMFLWKRLVRFNKLNFAKWLIVALKINILPQKHLVDRYFEQLKDYNINNDQKGLDYFINPEVPLPYELKQLTYCVLSIGGQHKTKRLPSNKIVELVNSLKISIVIVGGSADAEDANRIMKETEHNHVINFCGKASLHESARIIESSSFVITHDTGMMHIAAALKKRIVSIWGNTIPEFGMYPYFGSSMENYDQSRIFEVNGLSCRPCSKIGFEKCPKGHFDCMNLQDVYTIASYCNGL